MSTSNLRFVCLVLLAICIGLYFYTDDQKRYYDKVAIPVVKNILVDVSSWQSEPLLKHLSELAKNTINSNQLNAQLQHYQQFGSLVSIGELEFSRAASALSLFGQRKINYEPSATFSTGLTKISITLVHEDNSFKIYNLNINPM